MIFEKLLQSSWYNFRRRREKQITQQSILNNLIKAENICLKFDTTVCPKSNSVMLICLQL